MDGIPHGAKFIVRLFLLAALRLLPPAPAHPFMVAFSGVSKIGTFYQQQAEILRLKNKPPG